MNESDNNFHPNQPTRRFNGFRGLGSGGFTLIEVVLVLAIGGLIFLLAFLAFSQVSANRRDTQRRSDATRIVAELQNYYSSTGQYPTDSVNNGPPCTDNHTPGNFNDFVKTYMCPSGGFRAPQNNTYGPDYVINEPSVIPVLDRVRYKQGESCTGGSGSFRVEITMENGVVCRDSG